MKTGESNARRAMVRQYKTQGPAMGVYRISNSVTGRTVLHASRNVTGAMNRARFELRRGHHRDAALQSDWNAHGESAIQFEIVEIIEPRADPNFDVAEALATSLALWREELLPGGEGA
jgi:hypothetical protein